MHNQKRWDPKATRASSRPRKHRGSWEKHRRGTAKGEVSLVMFEGKTGIKKERMNGFGTVVEKSPAVKREAVEGDMGRGTRGGRVGGKLETGEPLLGLKIDQANAYDMPVIRVDGSSLRPKRRMVKREPTLGCTSPGQGKNNPSLTPRGIFKVQKQSWTLSKESKRLLQASIVSNKKLFLAKCEERFCARKG
ncbi:hypothetical protein BWQ96_03577 [Gracilariopsis chorda]|uniref:Uncharacterized protein n=1 Tax=Gracilariopsis chorda TaxID=448386 RepID=A0A2V3IWR4_9FLOR|nr:hypothetical protein BWQ96_03577 [Gracilariopsis chorda]|eukprot:PXF46588.1 hypothetical protein BWQ96_03577 [Gracilariopsis chorda]